MVKDSTSMSVVNGHVNVNLYKEVIENVNGRKV